MIFCSTHLVFVDSILGDIPILISFMACNRHKTIDDRLWGHIDGTSAMLSVAPAMVARRQGALAMKACLLANSTDTPNPVVIYGLIIVLPGNVLAGGLLGDDLLGLCTGRAGGSCDCVVTTNGGCLGQGLLLGNGGQGMGGGGHGCEKR
jgi:hypothetical protein